MASLSLSPAARAQVERLLRLIEAVESELRALDTELRRFARADRRCIVLQTIYGVGPILACHLLAELGEAAQRIAIVRWHGPGGILLPTPKPLFVR